MNQRRTTIGRLERRPANPQAYGLEALQQAHSALVHDILEAARSRGLDVDDPHEALTALVQASDPQHAQLTADLWLVFFECFRADEGQHELATFRQDADAINQRLAHLPHGAVPPRELVSDELAALARFWRHRHAQLSDRIDLLIGEVHRHSRQADSGNLVGAAAQDELARMEGMIEAGLGGTGTGTVVERLAMLLSRYRDELVRRRTITDANRAALTHASNVIAAMATGRPLPEGDFPSVAPLLSAVARIDEQRRALEADLRQAHRRIGDLEAAARRQANELAAAQEQLQNQPIRDDNDPRLAAYREAIARFRTGADPSAALAIINHMDNVLTLSSTQAEVARKAIDRTLTALVDRLTELWQVQPIGQDPQRFRPRWFKNTMDRKHLAGVLHAAHEASNDAVQWFERAHWAHSAQVFANDLTPLRKILRELVALVADWRKKLGEPPPASISISLDGGRGILALPAILQADVTSLLRRRNASAMAGELAVLLDAVHQRLRTTCVVAAPQAPAATAPGKRESASATCARHCQDLVALAAHAGAVLSEAADEDFVLDKADAQILNDHSLLRATATATAALCDELADLPGQKISALTLAPADAAHPLATWHQHAKQRAAWIAQVASQRVVLGS